MAAYNRSDYGTAIGLLRPLANQGNADAQNILGTMYDYGHGVVRDHAEATRWYLLSAGQGNVANHAGGVIHSVHDDPADSLLDDIDALKGAGASRVPVAHEAARYRLCAP
jgi:TPR repeat protein